MNVSPPVIAGLLLGMVSLTSLAAEKAPPPGGINVLPPNPLSVGTFNTATPEGEAVRASVERRTVEAEPLGEILRMSSPRALQFSYEAQFIIPLAEPLAKGDKVLFAAYVRGVESADETAETRIHIYAQSNTDDYPHTFDHNTGVRVGSEWVYLQLPFTVQFDIPLERGELGFGFAASKSQTLEIAGVQLLKYPPETDLTDYTVTSASYAGREANAPWRAEAEQRIEELRKGPLIIQVLDAQDQPVRDARVEVELQRHQFAFGSAVAAQYLTGPEGDAQSDAYRALVQELFNTVTMENDLKWPPWEGEVKNFNQAQTFAALRWLKDREIAVRGHVLVWPSWRHTPKRLRALESDPVALLAETLKHVREQTAATAEFVGEWDVLNEPYDNHDFMAVSGDYAMVQWFRAAHDSVPDKPLFINDYGILSGGGRDTRHQEHYASVIRYLLDRGAPLQGIGLQGHFGWDLTPPERLNAVLDRFAEFGKPLVITEFDVSITDEALQADYTRDFMITVFSHPAVSGFMQWGFWEGRHWRPEAAMFRRDFSPKPSAEAYRDLILRSWWTRDGGVTNALGRYETRGFYGEYTLTVSRGQSVQKVSASLKPAGGVITVTLP